MRLRPSVVPSICLALLSVAATRICAQDQPPPPVPASRIVDGGTRQTLESIYVPPLARAPFSLLLLTEWTRPLSGGGTYTYVNRRRIMRDSQGRLYEERWLLVPKGSRIQSTMNYIQVADPVLHTLHNCQVENKTCYLLPYSGSNKGPYVPGTSTSGPLQDGRGFHTHEDLGAGNHQGLDTVGYRETTTINPGVNGNDQPMIVRREFWYSPQLGIDLLSTLDSPETGKQTFTATEVTTSEPDPKFFAVPEGYIVDDQRKPDPDPPGPSQGSLN